MPEKTEVTHYAQTITVAGKSVDIISYQTWDIWADDGMRKSWETKVVLPRDDSDKDVTFLFTGLTLLSSIKSTRKYLQFDYQDVYPEGGFFSS